MSASYFCVKLAPHDFKEQLSCKRGSELTGARVSSALRRYKNRIIDGRMLKVAMDAGLKQVLFKIEKLSV